MNRVSRRITLLALSCFLLPTTVATAGVLEERLADARQNAKAAKSELRVIDRRQQLVVRQVTTLNRKLADLERPLRALEEDVSQLEYRIAQRETRVVQLRRDRVRQAKEIARLNTELGAARSLLAMRVVAAYKKGDTGLIEQLASSSDMRDLFEREEALAQVVGLDERVIARIAVAERAVRVKRARNFELRRQIREDILGLEADRRNVDARRQVAQQRRDEVAAVRAERDAALERLNNREEHLGEKLDDLEADAKVLRDVIKNGSSTYSGAIGGLSSSGFIWPVSGPVVSPFGPRWGRMHEGIDIAISAGNPIHATASGVVTHAGWMGGYGNMVVVQHAGGLATGYAHQSQIHVSNGQLVKQGQVLGLIGCTGHCYGDHLHFEVYVNGAPNDPMRFLGR